MQTTDLQTIISHYQTRIHTALDQRLPKSTLLPARLHEAMRYSTLNGGKRLRPILFYATAQAIDLEDNANLDVAACSLELIHAYSLIHDDLPAMDDDDLRRGNPTCHKAFDEATAILAGDSLQTLAFELLSQSADFSVSPDIKLQLIGTLSMASGSKGMAGGQAIDLESEGKSLTLAELENMHIHKTGALIRASVNFAAHMQPTLDTQKIQALDHYAKCIGLAFQVQDDILDIESDTSTLGKTQGKDAAQEKATYPSLMGLQDSKRFAQELCDDAIQSLNQFDEKADLLRKIATYIVSRSH